MQGHANNHSLSPSTQLHAAPSFDEEAQHDQHSNSNNIKKIDSSTNHAVHHHTMASPVPSEDQHGDLTVCGIDLAQYSRNKQFIICTVAILAFYSASGIAQVPLFDF